MKTNTAIEKQRKKGNGRRKRRYLEEAREGNSTECAKDRAVQPPRPANICF